jgi:N-acetylglucosamine-6-sulfatase
VRTADWKYIRYPHGDGSPDRHLAELYDLQHDPGEDHNLVKDPAQPPRIESLKRDLARLMQETGLTPETDKMPIDQGISRELPDQKIR